MIVVGFVVGLRYGRLASWSFGSEDGCRCVGYESGG